MKKFTLILLFGFTIFSCDKLFSQSKRVLKWEAQKAINNKDWMIAQQYYQRIFERDSTNLKVKYKLAELCKLNYELDYALKLFIGITKVDEGKNFPLAFYHIGQLYKNKELYKEAKLWFTRFSKINYNGDKSAYYNTKDTLEISACEWANNEMSPPKKAKKNTINVEHLSSSINSKSNEFAAVELDTLLYFSSAKFPDKRTEEEEILFNKIYRAEFKNKKWQKVRALDTNFNKPYFHNANATFNEDNTVMIISRCEKTNAADYECKLWLSKKIKGKWQVPFEIKDEGINLKGSTSTQANFGKINEKPYLFFASNRAGGEGGMDIWYAKIRDTTKFEKPVNAGKTINSVDDEVTPWFKNKTNTLYFSSNYYKGFGGFDIFKSEYKNGNFSEVQNAGYPVNSGHNDLYYNNNSLATKAYLTSNRVGSYFESKINCCNDIYRFVIDTLKPPPPKPIPVEPPTKKDTVRIAKAELKLLVPLTLYFNNDEPNPKTMLITTTKNYENLFYDYSRLTQVYVNEFTHGLNPVQRDLATEEVYNFFSDSLEAGHDHLKRFTEMLQKVVLNGETVKLTFKGYCSPLASTDYNVNLAKRRVSSLRNYFTEYNHGWFIKYINNQNPNEGKILFEEVDIGELSKSKASDNLNDKRNSVYSPAAACDRKIQILAISFGN